MSHKIHAIEYLTWDSEFFGFPVSRISASVGDSPKIILRKIDWFLSDGDGLCYVVLPLELHRILSSSLLEGFPLAILEGACFALPSVIVKELPGAEEMVVDGVAGIVSRNDVESYAESLSRLMADESLQRELGDESVWRFPRNSPVKRFCGNGMNCSTASRKIKW